YKSETARLSLRRAAGEFEWWRGSKQPEVYFDLCFDLDGYAFVLAGKEAPLLDRFDSLLVEAHTKALDDLNLLRLAIRVNDDGEHHRTAVLGFAGFFGVFRIHFA